MHIGCIEPRAHLLFLAQGLAPASGVSFRTSSGATSSYIHQVWRLATNFLFIGGLGAKLVFRMLWLYVCVDSYTCTSSHINSIMYGVQLEKGQFASSTADYVWMYCIGALTCLVRALCGQLTWCTHKCIITGVVVAPHVFLSILRHVHGLHAHLPVVALLPNRQRQDLGGC